MKIRAVTAFYDIGREREGDGRKTNDYLAWLNATLRLPLPFTIYLAPEQDASALVLKPEDRIARLPWSELYPARWLPQIEAICAEREKFPSKDDLTYRLPKYGPTNFAKLDLLAREASNAEFVMWIDAGASRLTRYNFAELVFRPAIFDQIMRDADLAIGARHHLYDYVRGRPHPPFPGLCQTLTNGGVVVVRASAAAAIRDTVHNHVETDWLPARLWDTEQTAIGEVILAGRVAAVIPEEDRGWLGVLGRLFTKPGIAWMGLRWDTPRGFHKSRLEDYFHAVRYNFVRAFRRAFILRSADRFAAARLRQRGSL